MNNVYIYILKAQAIWIQKSSWLPMKIPKLCVPSQRANSI